MITVTISINGNPIFTRSAVRVVDEKNGKPAVYDVDTGQKLEHFPHEGAVELAKKLLDTIVEPGTGGEKRR